MLRCRRAGNGGIRLAVPRPHQIATLITVQPMGSKPQRLSKFRYLNGLQCHKQLWWRVHDPEAPELSPTPGQQNLFAQGKEVGERAREYVGGGKLIDLPFYQYDNKVDRKSTRLNSSHMSISYAVFCLKKKKKKKQKQTATKS